MNEQRTYAQMQQAVQKFHDKYELREKGGEALLYRLALMAEELGEISECVTKGKPIAALAEECADLFILLIGTAIAADFDLEESFWLKMDELMCRPARMVDGRIRVSRFKEDPPNAERDVSE